MNKHIAVQPDCTSKCQSVQHGDTINAAITKRSVSDTDLMSFLTYICCCCQSIKDSAGRTVLHIAASCGRTDLVRWLVENREANINARDKESSYTALHRSIFYGKIDTAVELVKLGANLSLQDANGLTFLEHAMMDRFLSPDDTCLNGELFTWGTNSNNSLGMQLSRMIPESMDIFHREYPNENVNQILISQFHSVILTESGSGYTCGHGQGGRLGLGIQHAEVIPKLIKFPVTKNMPNFNTKIQIVSCSIARDHSVFLSSTGEIYTCGLNKHRVLGFAPPPAELLVPKLLKQLADDSSQVATGNYHSLVWNKSGIFSWGLNAGQLGHQLVNPSEKYILTGKKVSCINFNDTSIKLVCTSTGAIVVYTKKGDIYVLHEYQCRKIASRQLNLVQMAVIGGNLNHSLDSELSNKNRELKVAALTNNGNLFLWQEKDPMLRRCVFSLNRCLVIKQVTLNINKLLFVTNDGEAFSGETKIRKKNPAAFREKLENSAKSDFHKFVNRDECVTVKLEKIPKIHRAVSICSDPKGSNFGIVQERPYKFFTCYDIPESTMTEHMQNLLLSADISDGVTDVELKVSGQLYPAHKYVLASRSHYFANLFNKNHECLIELKDYHPAIFEELLMYIYTGRSNLIEVGDLKSESLIQLCLTNHRNENGCNLVLSENEDYENQSTSDYYSQKKDEHQIYNRLDNPVRMLHEMAKRFEIAELQKILSNLDMYKSTVKIKKGGQEVGQRTVLFSKSACPELYDVEILCKDNRVLRGHKCILYARLDYFGSMFSSRWSRAETSNITMPFAKGVVEALLEFLYTDSLDRLDEKDVDQLFKIIILADQFFVSRLKGQCENILSNLLTIKNSVQLLVFADAYNADNLKENCFEFIHQNMTSFLEMRLLEELEPQLLKELSEFYQMRRQLECRVITPYSTAVSDEEIAAITSICPVEMNENREKSIKDRKQKTPISNKKRSRTNKSSLSERAVSQPRPNDHPLKESNIAEPMEEILLDTTEHNITNSNSRVKSVMIANNLGPSVEIEDNFTTLSRTKKPYSESLSNTFVEFPLLNSPPKPSGFSSRLQKTESRIKIVKLSQKQRKRLSSENETALSDLPNVSGGLLESPKNPWKILSDPVSPINSPPNNMENIISSEKKQKENLVKITSKQLIYTQLEDKAIDELRNFYNADNIEDEIIAIERVSMGAVASPVWVPKTK